MNVMKTMEAVTINAITLKDHITALVTVDMYYYKIRRNVQVRMMHNIYTHVYLQLLTHMEV